MFPFPSAFVGTSSNVSVINMLCFCFLLLFSFSGGWGRKGATLKSGKFSVVVYIYNFVLAMWGELGGVIGDKFH